MAKDTDYIKLIHTTRWARLRKEILSAHPLCEDCEAKGLLTPATEVHHVQPVEEAYSYSAKVQRMYDASNLRALCHDCHVQRHTQLGRSGRVATKQRNAEHVRQVIDKFFK